MNLSDKLVIGAAVVSLIFIIIGHAYRDKIQALLQRPIYTVKEFNIDWWSVSHFMLFAFFGFVKPGYPLSFFTMGVVFEIFEDGMSSDATTQLHDCQIEKESVIGSLMCNGHQDSYWYSKLDDIFINLLGYVCGQALRTTYYPNLIKSS